MHKTESVLENEIHQIFLGFKILKDPQIHTKY